MENSRRDMTAGACAAATPLPPCGKRTPGALLVSGDPFFSSRRQPPPARAPGGPFLIESAILSFPLHPLRPHDARTRARAEDGKIDIYGITLPPARSGRHHISLSRCPSSGELLGRATNQLRRNSPFSLPR
jgi:hypothetical protein